MVDRIRALLALRQLTPTQFADLIQVGRPIVSHILSGRNKASLEVVQRIMAAFPEVALPWLLSGTGPMLSTEVAPQSTGAATAPAAVPVPVDIPLPASDPKLSVKAARSDGSPLVATAVKEHRSPVAPVAPSFLTSTLRAAQNGYSKPQKFNVGELKRQAVASRKAVSSQARPQGATFSTPGAMPFRKTPKSSGAQQQDAYTTEGSQSNREEPASFVAPAPPHDRPGQPTILADAAGLSPVAGDALAATVPFPAEKPIRRIIIFYRDGSFSDFQPES